MIGTAKNMYATFFRRYIRNLLPSCVETSYFYFILGLSKLSLLIWNILFFFFNKRSLYTHCVSFYSSPPFFVSKELHFIAIIIKYFYCCICCASIIALLFYFLFQHYSLVFPVTQSGIRVSPVLPVRGII